MQDSFEKNSLYNLGLPAENGYLLKMKHLCCVTLLLLSWVVPASWALDEAQGPVLHRLQRGQTLAALSRLYAVPLEALRELNADLDPHRLEVGCLIKIPQPESGWPEWQVEAGQRAVQLGHPLEVLRQLNPDVNLDELKPGQRLKVPRLEGSPEVTPPPTLSATPEPGQWELVLLTDGRKAWAPRSLMLIPSQIPLSPQEVVARAERFMGAPYTWGGQSPNGVDCSGFVHEVFRLSGHQLPRLADEQFAQTLEIEEPQLGDLVFFSTYLPGPSHVGISLGGRDFLHASSSRGVIRASLEEDYFKARYLGARRLPAWVEGPLGRL